jgi:hypothetical protein
VLLEHVAHGVYGGGGRAQGREQLGVRQGVEAGEGWRRLFRQDAVAELDAVSADVDARAPDQLLNPGVRLAAERAVKVGCGRS